MSVAGGRARRALAASIAAAVLVACTGDGDDPPTDTTAAATSGPAEAATVRLGLGGPLVVDPLEASLASPSDLMVLDLLHDGLTALDADGQAVAGLAVEWSADAAQQVWRFELDPDATFSSGRAVTADDVVASLTRLAAAGDTSLAALALEPVRGFRALADGEADTLAGVTAPDAATVEVVLDAPLSVLPEVLAGPSFGIVDPDALDPESLDLTGDWSPSTDDRGALVVERRRGEGDVDTVVAAPYEDPDAAYDAFDAGQVDWALVPPSRFGDAVEAHGDEHFAPFHAELFFGMNLSSPSLGNGLLRSAIVSAVDREAIVRAVYADRADPLLGIVPAGVPGHATGACDACAHDPERSEELVAALFPDGDVPTVRIDFDESPAQEQMATLLADDLEAVGIPTELRPLPLDEYKRFVVSGGQELFSFGWIGVYTSPDAYLAPLFVSDSDDNLTRFRSEEVDGFLARARAAADPRLNGERWTGAEAGVLGSGVVIPIAQFRTQAVVADRVDGFAHALDGTVDWSAVTADAGS
jgi:ABC-type transport system substrate-binding protein